MTQFPHHFSVPLYPPNAQGEKGKKKKGKKKKERRKKKNDAEPKHEMK